MPSRLLPASLRPRAGAGRPGASQAPACQIPDQRSGPAASRRSYGSPDQCATTAHCPPRPRRQLPALLPPTQRIRTFCRQVFGHPSTLRVPPGDRPPAWACSCPRCELCPRPRLAQRPAVPGASPDTCWLRPTAASPRCPDVVSRLAGADAIPAPRGFSRPSTFRPAGNCTFCLTRVPAPQALARTWASGSTPRWLSTIILGHGDRIHTGPGEVRGETILRCMRQRASVLHDPPCICRGRPNPGGWSHGKYTGR